MWIEYKGKIYNLDRYHLIHRDGRNNILLDIVSGEGPNGREVLHFEEAELRDEVFDTIGDIMIDRSELVDIDQYLSETNDAIENPEPEERKGM